MINYHKNKAQVAESHTTYIVAYRRDGLDRTVAFGDLESALQRVEEVSFDKACRNLRFKKQVVTVEESDMDYSDVRGVGGAMRRREGGKGSGRDRRSARAFLDNTLPPELSQKPDEAGDRKKFQSLEADHRERLKSLAIFLGETCERTLPGAKQWAKEWLNCGQIIPDFFDGRVASKRWMASVLSLHLEGKPLNFGALEGCPPYWETRYGQELLRALDDEQAGAAKPKRGSGREGAPR